MQMADTARPRPVKRLHPGPDSGDALDQCDHDPHYDRQRLQDL